jgi:hypothetical protein
MPSRRLLAASTVLVLAVACANGGVTGLQYEEDSGGSGEHEAGPGADGTTSGHDSGGGSGSSSGGNDATTSSDTSSGVDSSSGSDTGGGTCAQTCSGCCTGTTCVTTTSNNQCGTLGSPCQNCAASGLLCIDNGCLPAEGGTTEGGAQDAAADVGEPDGNPNCPTTCSGCCDSNDVCWTTHTDTHCPDQNSPGMTGQPCDDCTTMPAGFRHCFLDIIEYVCGP